MDAGNGHSEPGTVTDTIYEYICVNVLVLVLKFKNEDGGRGRITRDHACHVKFDVGRCFHIFFLFVSLRHGTSWTLVVICFRFQLYSFISLCFFLIKLYSRKFS